MKLGVLALAAMALASCARCGGSSPAPAASSSAAVSAPPVTSAAPPPGSGAPTTDLPDPPEVKDTGPGRATAALRAAFGAYGISFDAATLEKECEVDEEGASIDDLEDVANEKYGLDAVQLIVPREHALAPDSKSLPAIVILESPGDILDFVLVWRLEGDRALVMDPVNGRTWIPRAELEKRLDVQEITLLAEDWHAAESSPRFQAALRARIVALGVDQEKAKALVDRAAADPGSRGLGALEAAARALESDPSMRAGDVHFRLSRSIDCALVPCKDPPVPDSFSSSRPAPKSPEGQEQVVVRGAVILSIVGKRPPAP